MKSSVRTFLKPRAGDSAEEPARSRKVLLLVLGAFVAGTLFMRVIPQFKAKADSAASLPKSGPANLEDRLDTLENEQKVYVGQTRKLRGMLGSLLCNIEGAGSQGSSCPTEEQSSTSGDDDLLETGLTQALLDLSAKKRALTAWQDATSAATSGLAIFTRTNHRGSLGGEIASSPKVNVVTMEMCGLDSTSLEKALKGAPDFASGSRWLYKESWNTPDELVFADQTGAVDRFEKVVCLIGYIKNQNPCPEAECVMPVYARPGTSDIRVLKQMYGDLELNLLGNHEPKTILDGGANIGLASQMFGYMFPNATIVAVEAASNNYEMLLLNTAHLPNVIPIHAGIWPKTTALEVTTHPDGEWAHILVEKDVCTEGTECVNAVTIDLILDLFHLDHFDFTKIDIEASEKGVFTPTATNQLRWLENTSLLAIELHDRYLAGCTEAVTSALAARGFELTRSENTECVLAERTAVLYEGLAKHAATEST